YTFTGGVTLTTAGPHTVSARALGTLWPRASATVSVQADVGAHLFISAPTSAVAGVAAPVTVTVRDQWGNSATGFTGTVHFSSTDGSAVLPADYTFTAGDLGVRTFQVAFATAGTQSLTVTAPTLTDGQQSGILVKPGIAAQLDFVQQPLNAFIATPVKPPVTVQVADAFGNLVGAGVKVTLALGTNPGGAFLGGASAFTNANGIATFKALAISKKGQGYTLVAHAGTGTGPSSSPFTVYGVTHFGLNLSSSQAVAGSSLTTTVVALDAQNLPDSSYVGTVHFSSTDTLAGLPADYTFLPTDNGQQTFSVTLKRAGLQTVTVADTVKTTLLKKASVTVSAAAVSGFLVSGYPLTTMHNAAHTFIVTAVDAYGNRVTNYTGTVQFSNAGGTALLPGAYTFKAGDAGRHWFSATFQSVGSGQSLTVTDQNDPLIAGTESGINVT
ncbi:MAG TPA: hypothetical protein VKD71_07080, partial [Gemmataceae bacterium]|nr:hypothetical protein [Gemmataceae bacterium]